MTLLLPYFPSDIIPASQRAKIEALSSQREINSGLGGIIQMFGDYITTFSVLLTMNSGVGILAKLFIIGDAMMLFILMPQIVDVLRLFTDFISHIVANPFVGTFVGVAVVGVIVILGLKFIGSDVNAKIVLPNGTIRGAMNINTEINSFSTCESCIQNSGRWAWCDGVLNPFKTIVGCIPQGDFIANPDILLSFNTSCSLDHIWIANKLSGATIVPIGSFQDSSCSAFNFQFSVFGGG